MGCGSGGEAAVLIYKKLRLWLGALARLGLDRFLLPSVYFVATKGE